MNRYIWYSDSSDALTDWAIRPWVHLPLRVNFVQLLQFHFIAQCLCFISTIAFASCHICFKQNLAQVIILVAGWYIWYSPLKDFRSSCRKLTWVGFEPAATKFCSEALTNWAIRPWIQLTLGANFVQLLHLISLFSVHVSFQLLPLSVTTFALSEISH